MVDGVGEELSNEVLSVLVCPVDYGDLEYRKENSLLICKKCGKKYPVENGMPNMLGE